MRKGITMITLTESASTVVKTFVDRSEASQTAGLRIHHDSTPGFSVGITAQPEPSDVIVESEGARVFVAEDVMAALDDKVLDAAVTDDGSVRFALATRTA
jgi:iron-sulfur cluster assembly protein